MAKWILLEIFVVSLWFCNALSQSVNVPPEDESYLFIDRFKSNGLIQRTQGNTRPISRIDMAKFILTISQKRSELSSIEIGRLERIERKFKDELDSLGRDTRQIKKIWHPLSWEGSDGSKFLFDFVARAEVKKNNGSIAETLYHTTNGGRIMGNLKGSFGFYVDARDNIEGGREKGAHVEEFFEGQTGYVTPKEGFAYEDETLAYITFSLPWFGVELGKDMVSWGPGYLGNLALSYNPRSFDMIKLNAKYGQVRFVDLTGFLKTNLEDTSRSYYLKDVRRQRKILSDKYIAAHRIEVSLLDGLDIGLHEMVIYGERGLELGYLLPVMFFKSQEHYLGDRDNAAMGADIDIRLIKNFRVYGALFIDDISTDSLFTGRYGNKVGSQAGIHWIDPLGLRDAEFRAEYVRIEPYVYTHEYPINVYTQDKLILGHWLGPNADDLYIEANRWMKPSLKFKIFAERKRHGANESGRNVGGDVNLPYRPGDVYKAKFLDGILEQSFSWGIEAFWEPLAFLTFRVRYTNLQGKNALLDSGGRGKLRRNSFEVFAGYNYF